MVVDGRWSREVIEIVVFQTKCTVRNGMLAMKVAGRKVV